MAKKTPTQTEAPEAPPTDPRATLVARFLAARRAAVPLVWLATPDPAATVATLAQAVAERAGDQVPMALWDTARGLHPLNQAAEPAVRAFNGPQLRAFTEMALTLQRVNGSGEQQWPRRGIVFALNAHLALAPNGTLQPMAVQAAWNARDVFKVDRRMLVLLAPDTNVPAELRHDVIVLDEPLPSPAQLRDLVAAQYAAAKLAAPTDDTLDRAVDRLTGLAMFPAEQVTAMSLTEQGLDIEALTHEQARVINATPGLAVHRTTEDDDTSLMHGCDAFLEFANLLFGGDDAPRGVCWIDEIEKAFGGLAGDTSGTTQDQLGVVLQEMQDLQADGVLLVGHPGTGKSMGAKAVARRHRRPLVRLDLGAAKDGLVGSSEARVRYAFKTLRAVTGGRVLFIATSNGLGLIPPELRRRFRLGTFMFELPDQEAVASLLAGYSARYGLAPALHAKSPAAFREWSGAEIATACHLAKRLSLPVDRAAAYVVPVAASMPERITQLRQEAHQRYLDARRPGVFRAANVGHVGPLPLVAPTRAYGRES